MNNKKGLIVLFSVSLVFLITSIAKAAPDFTGGLTASSGSIGIGTASPGTPLHIFKNFAGVSSQLTLENRDSSVTNDGSSIFFKGYFNLGLISAYGNPAATTGGSLQLQTYSDNSTLNTGILIDRTGNVGVGTISPMARLSVSSSFLGANSSEQYGSYFSSSFGTANTGLKQGFRLDTSTGNNTGSVDNLVGLLSLVSNSGSGGNTNNSTSYWSRIDVGSVHSVTNAYNFLVNDSSIGAAGSMTNQYGLYVNNLAAATNNFAIYTAGTTKSYFGGSVGISATAPNDTLSIGNAGSAAPAGSVATGHNYTNTYLSSDNYALANTGYVKSLVASATSTMVTLWNGAVGGNISSANSGNTGIGTATPAYKLEVNGTSGFTSIDKIGPGSNNPERGAWNPIWSSIASGRAVYSDEEFALGANGVSVYNNAGGTGVQYFWEAGDGSQPNSSGKWIRIVNNGNATAPGYGGFYQTITCRRNATFVQRFRAKLPTGYTLNIAENTQGTNNTSYWLTSVAGTGKWEEYIRVSHCGNTGTFSNGGHVYVTGSTASFTWYLASSNVYEVDSAPGIFSGNVGIGTANPSNGKLQVAFDVPRLVGLGNAQLIIQGATDPNKQLLIGFDTTNNYSFIQPLHSGVNWSDYNLALAPAGGNVGIGTTAPISKLQVSGGTFRSDLGTTGVSAVFTGSGSNLQIAHNDGAVQLINSGYSGFDFVGGRITTDGSISTNDLYLGNYGWGSGNETGIYETSQGTPLAMFDYDTNTAYYANGGFSYNYSTGWLSTGYIQTNTINATNLNASGNVGVGTANPRAKLDILGSVNGGHVDSLVLSNSNSNNNSGTALYMGYQEAGLGFYGSRILQISSPAATRSSDLLFQIHGGPNDNADSSWNTALMIQRDTGNIGIGTTNPQAKLEVISNSFTTYGSQSDYVPVVFSNRNNKTSFYIRRDNIHENRRWLAHGVVTISAADYGWGSGGNGLLVNTTAFGVMSIDGNGDPVSGSGTVSYLGRVRVDGPGNENVIVWLRGGTTYYTDGIVVQNTGTYTDGYSVGGTPPQGVYGSVAITSLSPSTGIYGIPKGTYRADMEVNVNSTNYEGNYSVSGTVSAGAFQYSSDASLKKNISTIDNPLAKILQLRGVTFNWKKDNSPSVGLIAQEVEKVFPELVGETNGHKTVEYGNLVAPLIEAVKAQQKEINDLQNQINNLKK